MLARRQTCKKADKSARMIENQVFSTLKITTTKNKQKNNNKNHK